LKKAGENYVEILCNRLAPHLCQKLFQDIKTDGEYFSTGILRFGSEEVFVDVGAYIGDTVEQFQKQVAEKMADIRKYMLLSWNINFLNS
jgi:hypothetical protein